MANNNSMVSNSSIEFYEIQNDLIAHLKEKGIWNDFYEGSAGQTILELYAGVAAYIAHNGLTARRESAIQFANLYSSIRELAINRGVYVYLARAPLIRVDIKVLYNKLEYIKVGDKIGTFSNYDVFIKEFVECDPSGKEYYTTEPKPSTVGEIYTVNALIGIKSSLSVKIPEEVNFYKLEYETKLPYVCEELESLVVTNPDGTKEALNLITESLSMYNRDLINSVLRIPYESKLKFIFGNGQLGFKPKVNTQLEYSCLCINDDLDNLLNNISLGSDEYQITFKSLLSKPSYYTTKEDLRLATIKYSPDGRLVRASDIESFFKLRYGTYINDSYIHDKINEYDIYILPSDKFNQFIFNNLQLEMNKRKGEGIKINYFILREYSKITKSFKFRYTDGNLEAQFVNEIIIKYLSKYYNKILRENIKLEILKITTELNREIKNGMLYPVEIEDIEISEFSIINEIPYSLDYQPIYVL